MGGQGLMGRPDLAAAVAIALAVCNPARVAAVRHGDRHAKSARSDHVAQGCGGDDSGASSALSCGACGSGESAQQDVRLRPVIVSAPLILQTDGRNCSDTLSQMITRSFSVRHKELGPDEEIAIIVRLPFSGSSCGFSSCANQDAISAGVHRADRPEVCARFHAERFERGVRLSFPTTKVKWFC